jgi:hypothetical protein
MGEEFEYRKISPFGDLFGPTFLAALCVLCVLCGKISRPFNCIVAPDQEREPTPTPLLLLASWLPNSPSVAHPGFLVPNFPSHRDPPFTEFL